MDSNTLSGDARPRSTRGRTRALVLLLVHVVIAAHIAHWAWTGRSVTPVEPSEAALVWTEGVVNAGLVLLVLVTLGTLVFGRFFCGWACHVVALQDACAWLLGRMRLRPKPIRSRVLVFVPVVAAIEIFVLPAVLRVWSGEGLPELRWHLVTDDLWSRFPGPWMAITTLVVVGFAAVWLFGSKGFCTYGCPYGAIFGAADRFARGRIRVSDACEGCGHCTAVCTSNVRVHEEVRRHRMVVDPGCMKCMDCVSACPKDALSFAFGPTPSRAAHAERRTRRFDFTGREEFALALLFVGGLYAFRGLYGAVPFLLAIALATALGLAVVLAARLVARRDVRFQHGTWRRAGKLTRAGALAAGAILLYVAFAVQSAAVQYDTRSAARSIEAARAGIDPVAAIDAAAAHLARARRLGFREPVALERRLASLEIGVGRPTSAVERLSRIVAASPDEAAPRFELFRACVAAGDRTAAIDAIEGALAATEREGAAPAPERAARLALDVAELVRLDPSDVRAVVAFAHLQALAGDVDTARANAARLLERHPHDPRVRALAERLAPGEP